MRDVLERIANAVFWLGAFAFLVGFWTMVGIEVKRALAHTAPSGWVYPNACCRDHMDCQMISSKYVRFEKDFIVVELPPGVHRHAPEGIIARLRYDDVDRVRPSGDGDMHACVGIVRGDRGSVESSTFRCLYITGGV